MICMKSSAQMKAIFQKTFQVMGTKVEWDGMIFVHKNSIIFPGKSRSVIFSLDTRKVVGTVVDMEDAKRDGIILIKDKILENAFNMLLYIFGKWDQIKGLTVEKNYDQLERMINSVLTDIDATAIFKKDKCDFFRDGEQIEYEEIIHSILILLEPEKQRDEENDNQQDVTSDSGDADFDQDELEEEEEKEEEEFTEEDEQEDWFTKKYRIGLWHKIVWNTIDLNFQKEQIPAGKRKKNKLGRAYYLSNYQCPECGSFLHMVIYPVGKEFMIDTDQGEVMLARVYTCSKCMRFYTPRPRTMMIEGATFVMDFEKDQVAYDDYLDLTSEQAARVSNCNFNEFVSDIERQESMIGKKQSSRENASTETASIETDQDLKAMLKDPAKISDEHLITIKEQMDDGFYPAATVKHFDEPISKELHKRGIKKMQSNDSHTKSIQSIPRDRAKKKKSTRELHGQVEREKIGRDENEHEQNGREEDVREENTRERIGHKENGHEQNGHEQNGREEDVRKRIGHKESEQEQNVRERNGHERNEQGQMKNSEQSRDAERGKYASSSENTGQSADHAQREQSSQEGQENKDYARVWLKSKDKEQKQDSASSKQNEMQKQQAVLSHADTETTDTMSYEQMAKEVSDTQNASYDTMKKLYHKIKAQNVEDSLKVPLLEKLRDWMKQRGQKEVHVLSQNIPDRLSKKQYHLFQERISQYKDAGVDVAPLQQQLDDKRDIEEKNEITQFIKKINRRPNERKSLMQVYEQLKQQGFEKRNIQPFLDKIKDKIKQMDLMEIKRICPDVSKLSTDEAKEVQKKIQDADFLPELKEDILTKIERRLSLMKRDESEQLNAKFKRDFMWEESDYPAFTLYDVRRMNQDDNEDEDTAIFDQAVRNIAGELERYEYPVFYCDMSHNQNGKSGFILTPEHLYYSHKLSRGVLDVASIQNLHETTGLLNKGIYAEYQGVGDVKISGLMKNTQISESKAPAFLKNMNEFLTYLQEKPESRNINYMAKEEHIVKCCYRCGFKFKEGEVCPRCGAIQK